MHMNGNTYTETKMFSNSKSCWHDVNNQKHLLRYMSICARSSTLNFAGAVNTRQNMTVHINNLVPSESK